MTKAQAAQQNNRDGAGKYATKAVGESDVDLGTGAVVYPEMGSSAVGACPAHYGRNCVDHGQSPQSHPGDLEIRACREVFDGDDPSVESNVPEHEAEFWTVYGVDEHGLSMALEDFDSRESATEYMRETALAHPVDIDGVRAAVDTLDPTNSEDVYLASKGALAHLPGNRVDALKRLVHSRERLGAMAKDERDTMYAELVDATQDVPTAKRMKEVAVDLHKARMSLTDAYKSRDMGFEDAEDEIRVAQDRVETAVGRYDRGWEARTRATMARVEAGRPTVLDGQELEDRLSTANISAKSSGNAARRVREEIELNPKGSASAQQYQSVIDDARCQRERQLAQRRFNAYEAARPRD